MLCVGLDPEPARFPPPLAGRADAIFEFCRAIVDATAPYACAFKPQIAYFSAYRAEAQLEALIAYIHAQYPGIPVVLDAKRGDIGSTAALYAREAFERYRADALTVNPYLGGDSIVPYFAYSDKGVIVLCRTSNAGGAEVQLQRVGDACLYQIIARRAVEQWNTNGQLGLVVGATFPAEIAAVRRIAGDEVPLLVPGVGVQGGEIGAAVQVGRTRQGAGLLINVSRAVLYAGNGADFALAAARTAQRMRDAINIYRGFSCLN